MSMNSKIYYKRRLDLDVILKRKSCFLFGPRETGKTSYIMNQLESDALLSINLKDSKNKRRINTSPEYFYNVIESKNPKPGDIVIIKEVQECPFLLDDVQILIDRLSINFLLTGSSARKLKRESANLLGGRATWRNMNSFSIMELQDNKLDYNLLDILNYGTLPNVFICENKEEELDDYSSLYVQIEIEDEGLTRNIETFYDFLSVAALHNSNEINFNNIASDTQVKRDTVIRWYSILEDTLMGFFLHPYRRLKSRKSIQRSKFYFFDLGVARKLKNGILINEASSDYGAAFEAFIILEIKKYLNVYHPRKKMNYIRTQRGLEIDCLLDASIAIEIKASNKITDKHIKNLKLIEEDFIKRKIVVCNEEFKRGVDGIEIYPFNQFIKELYNGEIINR